MHSIIKWFKIRYDRTINSIAFYPVLIALLFMAIAISMVYLDYSETGKNIKDRLIWTGLRDSSTARSIISAIAAGIISLTVFSFSMVMIVLNQAASQMSNRVLDNLIGNRFQQIVLGIYIGTIVYSLFLLSTIRDNDNELYIPALSIYLLIALTIADIFLFIYFLHYITNSVKYETIIKKIFAMTISSMKNSCRLDSEPDPVAPLFGGLTVESKECGIFQGIDINSMLEFCEEEDLVVQFHHSVGSFLLQGTYLATLSKQISREKLESFYSRINIHGGQAIEKSYYFGINQLTEVALKALSPGINDPGTAITSLQSIAEIIVYRMTHFPDQAIRDEKGILRIITTEKTIEEIFAANILPIWDYGKKDRILRKELNNILGQLNSYGDYPIIQKLLKAVEAERSAADISDQ